MTPIERLQKMKEVLAWSSDHAVAVAKCGKWYVATHPNKVFFGPTLYKALLLAFNDATTSRTTSENPHEP